MAQIFSGLSQVDYYNCPVLLDLWFCHSRAWLPREESRLNDSTACLIEASDFFLRFPAAVSANLPRTPRIACKRRRRGEQMTLARSRMCTFDNRLASARDYRQFENGTSS